MRILWFSSRERLLRRRLGQVGLLRGLLVGRSGLGVLLTRRGRCSFLLEVDGGMEECRNGLMAIPDFSEFRYLRCLRY